MSIKKDVLERITREERGAGARRTEPAAAAAAAPVGEEVAVTTKRVSRKVVRRRRKKDDVRADDKPAAPPVRRKVVDAPPQVEVQTPETTGAQQAAPPAAAPEAPPAADAAPAPEPAAAQAAAEPPKAEPADKPAKAEPAAASASEPAADAAPAGDPPAEAPAAAAAPAPEKKVHANPRLPGLGPAVVVPPPGYDPTNPEAYRKTIEAQQAQAKQYRNEGGTTSWRRGRRVAAGAPGAPAAPGATPGAAPGARPGPADTRNARRPGRRQRRTGFDRPANPRRKSRRKSSGPKKASPAPKAQKRKIRMDNVISVGQLAKEMSVKASAVIRELMDMGQMVRVNDMLDVDTATLVATEFEYEVENVGFQESNFLQHFAEDEDDANLVSRPPVVTIMGHVDHGKTTLLDAIRNARVAQGEAGGITQHVGAYQIDRDGQKITFIDTPGHAAFTQMRARGAQVTDIVILVVAVDDGVQPQTEEAIAHARAAEVPILVAVNKMDKPDANPEAIKNRLGEFGLAPEDWGGETLYAHVSALKGEGIDELLDQILLQAEVLDLQANPERPAEGVVIEAKMERGRGAVASILVQSGTLKRNDFVVLGAAYGKVRAMLDDQGNKLKVAGPSTPVEIFGLSELPEVGDSVSVVKTEKDARKLAEHRAEAKRLAEMSKDKKKTAEDIFAAAAGPQNEQLQIVLKADVQGSLEALKASLQNIEVAGTEVRILHAGVGNISESDVTLVASSSHDNTAIIGFNVRIDAKARQTADQLGVSPRVQLFEVIYSALDYAEARLKGMLEPEYEHVKQGTAEVRATFSISKLGTIAGLYVTDGKVLRNGIARVMREGEQLWEGKVSTLKRFKDDVKEVTNGYECGMALEGYNDIVEGDIIEVYTLEVIEVT